VLVVCALLVPEVAHADFGISMSGPTLSQGRVKPDLPAVTPYATQLTVHASAPWTLQATAPSEFVTSGAPVQTMPISRQEWRIHSLGGAFTPFIAGLQTLLGAQPPTPPNGTSAVLDFRLNPEFSDLPTKEDGTDPYRAAITYSVTSGTIDASFAAPNPFSPDGDSLNDRCEIHWYQGVPRAVDVQIFRDDQITLVRTIVLRAPFVPGDSSVTWDGRDDNRNLVAEGDYFYRVRVNPAETVEPGLTLASGLIGVERGATTGTAIVLGTVTSTQGGPVAGATARLRRAGGLVVNTQTTDALGAYAMPNLPAGIYTLEITAPLHFGYVSTPFELTAGQSLRVDIQLVHNHSLTIQKKADVTDAEPGDVVTYEIKVSTQGGVETVQGVTVDDDLPAGLRLVPGSARIGGRPVAGDSRDLPGVLRGHRVRFPVGDLPANTVETLTYDATVVAGTRPGRLRNAARASGFVLGARIETATTSALIYVHAGEMGDRSLVFGRVFVDVNGDGVYGKGDRIPSSVRVVIDDGTVIIADPLGRYSIKGLSDGRRAIMAVVDADPLNTPTQQVPAGPSRVELVDLRFGAPRRVNFAFRPSELDDYKGSHDAKTTLAVVDVRLGLDRIRKGDAPTETVLTLLARSAAFFERDLGGKYRLTGSLDTRRDPRDELGMSRDPLSLQPEVGDESTSTPPPIDKLGLRLIAPWGGALVGRTGVSFNDTDLVASSRSFLGVETTVATKYVSVRAFGGRADSLVRLERIANDGTTGPYRLGASPIVRGNVRLIAETVSSTGEFVAQIALAEGADYELDYTVGLLYLNRPFPLLTPDNEVTVFVIEYEFAPETELPPAWISGLRAEGRVAKGAVVGTSMLSEQGSPIDKRVVGLDARYQSTKVDASAEVARTTPGPTVRGELPSDDPNAARVRATVRPREDLRLFGFFNQIGGGYAQRVNFRAVTPAGQAFGYLPPPSQSLFPPLIRALSDGQREFPFTLQGAQDRREFGLGSQFQPSKTIDVTAGGSYTDRGFSNSGTSAATSSIFVAGRYKPKLLPSLFLAGTQTIDASTGGATRTALLGSSWVKGDLQLDGEYRFRVQEQSPPAGNITGHAALVRSRYLRWQKFQPGLLVEASRDLEGGSNCELELRGCTVSETEIVAAGFESQRKKLGMFMYGSIGRAIDRAIGPFVMPRGGVFGGFVYSGPVLTGSARMDASHDYLLGNQLAGAARLRAILSRSLAAFASLQYKSGTDTDSRSQWNNILGFALRPFEHERLFVFLKFKDRKLSAAAVEQGSRRTYLATADIVLPVGKRISLGTRVAWKSVSAQGGPARLAMTGEEVTYHVARRWDLISGLRVAYANPGGETVLGATAGVGYWFTDALRLVGGVDHAKVDWAFEADDSIPGFFINLTGVYGAAGAPAELQ